MVARMLGQVLLFFFGWGCCFMVQKHHTCIEMNSTRDRRWEKEKSRESSFFSWYLLEHQLNPRTFGTLLFLETFSRTQIINQDHLNAANPEKYSQIHILQTYLHHARSHSSQA